MDERVVELGGGSGGPRGAVFLDRDDTLIANRTVTATTAHPGDLFDPALVQLLPGAAAGCRLLARAGFALVVVSNQGAVARGRCSIAQVEATNARVRALLAREGVTLDGVYYCPHHPKGTVAPWNTEHPWRKPAPGMLLAAAEALELDLARSWMIGDAARDIEAALAAGIAAERAILVGDAPAPESVRRCEDVPAAARVIVGETAGR